MNDPVGWVLLGCGAAAWMGVLAGGAGPWVAVSVAIGGVGTLVVRSSAARALGVVLVAGVVAGWAQGVADAGIGAALEGDPGGTTRLVGRLVDDGRARPAPGVGWYGRLRPTTRDGLAWPGPDVLVSVPDGEPPPAGTTIEVTGRLAPGETEVRGRPVAGVVAAARWDERSPPTGLLAVAEAIRHRVRSVVSRAPAPGGPLLAGFLLGDTSAVDPVVTEDLRAAGLSHYVAVSGSNVALFLVGWWIVTLPLAVRPRLRWAVGWAGLVLFATVTRWEPSVVRASAMSALALGSRRAGIVVSGRGLLGAAVGGALLVAPSLAHDLGFQLSVAATAGLLAGARRRGAGPARALRATVAAQLAVAPLLLATVGEVPLAGPIANLLAAPLVSVATVVGAIASVAGLAPLAVLAGRVADLVVAVARLVAPLPTIGWWGLAVVAGLLVAWRWPRGRPVTASLAAVGLVGVLLAGGPGPGPWVAFLDVGQGDAAIVRGASGATVVVDGGPDPAGLADALRRHRVTRVDLLVVSHRHADHVTGLGAVVGHLPVGGIWHPRHRDFGAAQPLFAAADDAGIARWTPPPGTRATVGDVEIAVLGPLRRYASPNDESLVLLVEVGGISVLFAGDIETFAQADLGPIESDVLKVPHQGAATSDRGWLAASAGSVSIISVGDNDFGHPADWVVETLEAAGSTVCRTDRDGDIVVRPGSSTRCGS